MIAIASKQFLGDNVADMVSFGEHKGESKIREVEGGIEVLAGSGWQVVEVGMYVQYDWYGVYRVVDANGEVIDGA